MPRNNRQWVRRKLQNAMNNIDNALAHLYECYQVYKDNYAKITKGLECARDVLNIATDTIDNVRKQI